MDGIVALRVSMIYIRSTGFQIYKTSTFLLLTSSVFFFIWIIIAISIMQQASLLQAISQNNTK
jgi:hypothetical protein